jgi:sulfoxide reductase heme-binding subunit YedZ
VALAYDGLTGNLTANPISRITNETGEWTLKFIAITLAITPLRNFTRQHWLGNFRRMVGLFAFFYGCLHFTTYIWLDQFFDVNSILKDIVKRPFITVGFASFVLMIPLAITSTKGMIRRMGGKNWNLLHRLIYVTGIGGVIHYYWLVKADVSQPLMYAAIIGTLLGSRILWKVLKKRKSKVEPVAVPEGA